MDIIYEPFPRQALLEEASRNVIARSVCEQEIPKIRLASPLASGD